MKVFVHHIYELKKGLRRLVLHTFPLEQEAYIRKRLDKEGIPYLVHHVNRKKGNVFFGYQVCIDVLRQFETLKLNEISDQEDFILGTLLGYDTRLQCLRYLERAEENRNQFARRA